MMDSWLSVFSGKKTGKKKPVKIRGASNKSPVGIVAESVEEVVLKAKEKLGISGTLHILLEEDGTEIDDDDYFQTLDAHTTLVILESSQRAKWTPTRKLPLDGLLQFMKSPGRSQQLSSMLQGGATADKQHLLSHLLNMAKDGSREETKKEDPDWFIDLNERFRSKDEYMRENARRRVRGYLRVAEDYIKKQRHVDHRLKEDFKSVLSYFFVVLKDPRVDFYSDYFSRKSTKTEVKFCDDRGWFRCEGLYNMAACHHHHVINPYQNRHERLLFSQWNLDHRIEKSREVLPSLLSALQHIPRHRQLNNMYFYSLLFTRENLNCVHVVCHDKTEHTTEKCNPNKFYK